MTGPRWGVPQSWLGTTKWGTSSQIRMGYPWPGQDGVPPPGQDRVSPSQDWGIPQPGQDELQGIPGYPSGQVTLGHIMLRAERLLRFPAGGLSCYGDNFSQSVNASTCGKVETTFAVFEIIINGCET